MDLLYYRAMFGEARHSLNFRRDGGPDPHFLKWSDGPPLYKYTSSLPPPHFSDQSYATGARPSHGAGKNKKGLFVFFIFCPSHFGMTKFVRRLRHQSVGVHVETVWYRWIGVRDCSSASMFRFVFITLNGVIFVGGVSW